MLNNTKMNLEKNLNAVYWSHTLYIFLGVLILFVALLYPVRNLYKK